MKRADIHTEHINNLILSFLNRTISSTDLKVLKEWIDENEDNKAYFSEIQKIWLISSIYEKKNFDKLKDRAFQQFKDRIAQKNQEQDIYISRPNWNRIFYIAACIIIAFFAGIGVMYFTGNQRLSDQTLSYSVESPRGSKLKLSLPDGTSVWLNADSKLLYDNNFGINNRDVTLCGEGLFANHRGTYTIPLQKQDVKLRKEGIYVSAAVDAQGEIILKLVNTNHREYALMLEDADGLAVRTTGQMWTLRGTGEMPEDRPEVSAVTEETAEIDGCVFIPAQSLVVIRYQ